MSDLFKLPHFDLPEIHVPRVRQMWADGVQGSLIDSIKTFQDELAPDEEVGGQLASFGNTVTIAIDAVEISGDTLIKLHGRNAEQHRCVLVQHMSQVNVLLIAIKVVGRPAHRIGFNTEPST